MQLLHGLFSFDFISDIPLSPATLFKAQCQSGNKKSFISLNLGQKYFIVERKNQGKAKSNKKRWRVSFSLPLVNVIKLFSSFLPRKIS
jgi:hypothetical protein